MDDDFKKQGKSFQRNTIDFRKKCIQNIFPSFYVYIKNIV